MAIATSLAATVALACPPVDAARGQMLAAAFVPGDAMSAQILVQLLDDEALGTDGAVAVARLREQAGSVDDPFVDAIALPGLSGEAADAHRARLAAAARTNAYFALVLLGGDGDDAARASGYLAAMAGAPHYESGYVRGTRSLFARLQRVPGMEAADAFELAMARAPLPSFGSLVRACRAPVPERSPACRAIAATMLADAETLIDGAVAAVVASDSARTDAERAQARTTQRRWRWWVAQSPSLWTGEHKLDAAGAERFRATWLARGEVAAVTEALAQRGIPLDPPATWEPGQTP